MAEPAEHVLTQSPPRLDPGTRLRRLGAVALGTLPVVLAVATDFPLCPTAGLFGIPCPGCGLTRATIAVLHGHFAEAIAFHPLVFLVAPAYIWVMAGLGFSYVRGGSGRAPNPRLNRMLTWVAIVTFALLFAVWMARFAGYLGGPAEVVTFGAWRRG